MRSWTSSSRRAPTSGRPAQVRGCPARRLHGLLGLPWLSSCCMRAAGGAWAGALGAQQPACMRLGWMCAFEVPALKLGALTTVVPHAHRPEHEEHQAGLHHQGLGFEGAACRPPDLAQAALPTHSSMLSPASNTKAHGPAQPLASACQGRGQELRWQGKPPPASQHQPHQAS